MFPGALEGVDPITAAREAIGLGLAAQTYGSKFFAQGATPSGVIETPGVVTMDQARELAQQWRQAHGGLNKANLPAVLTGGARYSPISITPEQAQFLETRRYTDEQVYKLFGLTHPFSPTTGPTITYANVEQLGTDVTRFTLMPWLVRLEKAFTNLLPRPQYAKFNVDAFLRSDLRTRYESYKIGIETGFLEVNEARAWENLDPMNTSPNIMDEPAMPAA
jgi:HK97 family phage portal protein